TDARAAPSDCGRRAREDSGHHPARDPDASGAHDGGRTVSAIPPARTTVNLTAEGIDLKLGRRAPLSEQIAEWIRNMIVAGDLKPGERIVESRIARQIGVGQPTVREALVALEHQGLIVRKANSGCVVTSLTRAEICQLIRVRAELETLAVELAVESAADSEIDALLAITKRMEDAAAARDPQRFFEEDLAFHQALW